MNLESFFGIAGRRAIVCGSSRGLGRACAESLLSAGVEVVLNSRNASTLQQVADELSERFGRTVHAVAADVSYEEGRTVLMQACPDIDILVNNAGGPPPGIIEDWGEAEWFEALNANMVAPILLMRSVLPGMRERGWGRIINITSAAVKAPLPRLGLSNGARAGLTGLVAGLAREIASDGVTINNLLPGRFATDRLRSYMADIAVSEGTPPDRTWDAMLQSNPSGRVGRPEEFGAFCLFIASQSAGFMTGQNILLDGGEYRGLL